MKNVLLNSLLIGSIAISVIFAGCNKDEATPDNPDYTQPEGVFKDSRDNKEYKWVKIGEQIWMAENLSYASGKHIIDEDEWYLFNDSLTGAYCWYDNDVSNKEKYGTLYTYTAASNACPEGWHLPNDAEWTKLENFITSDGNDGTEGSALKSLSGWNQGGGGTDDYGFTGLPGGLRNGYSSTAAFLSVGNTGYWWSSTAYESDRSSFWSLRDVSPNISHGDHMNSGGLSVRCIKD